MQILRESSARSSIPPVFDDRFNPRRIGAVVAIVVAVVAAVVVAVVCGCWSAAVGLFWKCCEPRARFSRSPSNFYSSASLPSNLSLYQRHHSSKLNENYSIEWVIVTWNLVILSIDSIQLGCIILERYFRVFIWSFHLIHLYWIQVWLYQQRVYNQVNLFFMIELVQVNW